MRSFFFGGKMEAYQERVCIEANELRGRLNKLTVFVVSSEFKKLEYADQNLLAKQQKIMADYLEILRQRIIRFD